MLQKNITILNGQYFKTDFQVNGVSSGFRNDAFSPFPDAQLLPGSHKCHHLLNKHFLATWQSYRGTPPSSDDVASDVSVVYICPHARSEVLGSSTP